MLAINKQREKNGTTFSSMKREAFFTESQVKIAMYIIIFKRTRLMFVNGFSPCRLVMCLYLFLGYH